MQSASVDELFDLSADDLSRVRPAAPSVGAVPIILFEGREVEGPFHRPTPSGYPTIEVFEVETVVEPGTGLVRGRRGGLVGRMPHTSDADDLLATMGPGIWYIAIRSTVGTILASGHVTVGRSEQRAPKPPMDLTLKARRDEEASAERLLEIVREERRAAAAEREAERKAHQAQLDVIQAQLEAFKAREEARAVAERERLVDELAEMRERLDALRDAPPALAAHNGSSSIDPLTALEGEIERSERLQRTLDRLRPPPPPEPEAEEDDDGAGFGGEVLHIMGQLIEGGDKLKSLVKGLSSD